MTIKQYQTIAKTIASKIEELGGNPQRVRSLRVPSSVVIEVRDPNQYDDSPTGLTSGESNMIIEFNTISNPNNPNYKFRTLKPGSMSLYNSDTDENVDVSDYRFDSAQLKAFTEVLKLHDWQIYK